MGVRSNNLVYYKDGRKYTDAELPLDAKGQKSSKSLSYLGDMSVAQANKIMEVRDSKEIGNIVNMLYSIPFDIVLDAMERKEAPLRFLPKEEIANYKTPLRDYQTVGVGFMYYSPHSMLADGCGLGKTAETAALLNLLRITNKLKRFIFAAENSAVAQVQAELIKYTALNVVAIPTTKPKMEKLIETTDWSKVDGIVIAHSTLRSNPFMTWMATYITDNHKSDFFNVFILDESSVIKNQTTLTYTYVCQLVSLAERVHMLNATAFETKLQDIYFQLDILCPYMMPSKSKFEHDYCVIKPQEYWTKRNGKAERHQRFSIDSYKNANDFKDKVKLVYFGRSSEQVGYKNNNEYYNYLVEPTDAQKQAIKSKYDYNIVLNCPSLIDTLNIKMTREDVPKLDRCCSLIENEFNKEKVMIYCFHRNAQDALKVELEKIGRNPRIINGDTNQDRELSLKIQNDFNNGDVDVIITNAKKSLNLYGGNVCILYSVPTNPATTFQVASRIDRHVDNSIKTFVTLLYKDSPEYDYFKLITSKRASDSRRFTIDAKSTADLMMDNLEALESSQKQ